MRLTDIGLALLIDKYVEKSMCLYEKARIKELSNKEKSDYLGIREFIMYELNIRNLVLPKNIDKLFILVEKYCKE